MTTGTENSRKEVNVVTGGIILVVALIVVLGGAYFLFMRSSGRVEAQDTVFQRPGGQSKVTVTPEAASRPAMPTGAITGGGGITAVPGSRTSPFGPH